jgi:hypothetical protein
MVEACSTNGEKRVASRVLLGKSEGKRPQLEGLCARIILKWIFKKWDGQAWTGLIWLRIRKGSGLY